jgi:hypothetical protein
MLNDIVYYLKTYHFNRYISSGVSENWRKIHKKLGNLHYMSSGASAAPRRYVSALTTLHEQIGLEIEPLTTSQAVLPTMFLCSDPLLP